ncbi:MAG: glycogen/starch synthase, partial [Campylobacterota bacterium]|nr:glycogen/starch synthase [Campylobacterota bacterium]
MKLLFASAEIYPYAKTGGLADVVQALPRALSEKIEVCSVMPLYDFIDREVFNISPLDESFRITLGDTIHQITLYYGFNQGVETLFVYEPMLCGKSSPYGDDSGDYPDNDLRFGLFSKALVIVARLYAVDILHLNDWHTALAALWAREMLPDLRTVFTIHNLAFQGIFSRESMQRLGLDHSYFKSESIEFWEQVNYMKAGIAYSDIVTTVSPRYAQEILQPDFGFGLDGFLQAHSHKLFGILNGIDTLFFDPENDPALPHNYNSSSLQTKKLNKDILCEMRGFEQSSHPLFIFIGRFTHQKGLDIIAKALPDLLKMKLNLAIIGEGDRKIATELQSAAQHHKNFSVYFGYDETLSHQMYAAADFLLMPSSFEPCGLNQLIAMRYGTLPVVH